MKITEALIAEHTIFLAVFDQIEKALPSFCTPTEVRTMAQVVERMLTEHARTETDLAYLALDHALAHEGRLDHMHQEHHEVDDRLSKVHAASTCSEGRLLLQGALSAARDHFRAEERVVFPLIERTLEPATLVDLGTAWLNRKVGPSSKK